MSAPPEHDEQPESEELDGLFDALANRHRREIIRLLSLQPFAINQLAAARQLSLPAINKHITILERADLVRRRKIGRTNVLTLKRASLQRLQEWVMQYHP